MVFLSARLLWEVGVERPPEVGFRNTPLLLFLTPPPLLAGLEWSERARPEGESTVLLLLTTPTRPPCEGCRQEMRGVWGLCRV